MNALLATLLVVFAGGYLVQIAWTGEIGTRSGVFFRRTDDPTVFWAIWALAALAYAYLIYDRIGVVLDGASLSLSRS
jgi:hypothetical protein